MLRAVAASLPDAHTAVIYWRGMKDLGLTMEFLQKGGTVRQTALLLLCCFSSSCLPLGN
jgi:hypothetical protein